MIVPVAAVALTVATSPALVNMDESAAVVPASVSVVPFVVMPLVSPTTAALSYSKRVLVPLAMDVVPTVMLAGPAEPVEPVGPVGPVGPAVVDAAPVGPVGPTPKELTVIATTETISLRAAALDKTIDVPDDAV